MLKETEHNMLPIQRVCLTLGVIGLIAAVPIEVSAQSGSGFLRSGSEFAPAGSLPGDQVYPDIALTPGGGLIVWQDNITDGDGLGISALRLDGNLSPIFSTFRVNQTGAGDQERARAAILTNGGSVVVWQGGPQGYQHIYGGFLGTNNTFLNTSGDVMISTATNCYQLNPAVAALANGNAVVVWGSFGQDNADGFQGVYAQVVSPSGQKIGGEFPVNTFTPFNQRTPAVAALPNGNFVVAWVSEGERSTASVAPDGTYNGGQNSVDIFARLFDTSGNALSGEFLVNTDSNVCANPAVAVASDGTFTIAWGEKNTLIANNSWDIYSRQFTAPGSGGAVQVVNTQLYGDQYSPRIASLGTNYLVSWTSLGQDGSREGVYAQFLQGGAKAGPEFRVNTTVLNSQEYQAVASDGASRFMAVWSSYVGVTYGMDLYAQRYVSTNLMLAAPAAPVVSALDSYTLSATWSPLAGYSVDHWNLMVDTTNIVATTNTYWQNQGLNTYTNMYEANSTHTFQLEYVLTGGAQSPLSAIVSGQTWGPMAYTQLPVNWETQYWGSSPANWPNWNTVLHAGGLSATAQQVFLWGANPTNAATWLVQSLQNTAEGEFLTWSTQPGYIYQVQSATANNLSNWTNLGAPRFAAGTSDSIYLGMSTGTSFTGYRIRRVIY
jgi:hypothetical protein